MRLVGDSRICSWPLQPESSTYCREPENISRIGLLARKWSDRVHMTASRTNKCEGTLAYDHMMVRWVMNRWVSCVLTT